MPPPPPSEPQAEERLAFQRLLQEYASSSKKAMPGKLKGKLIGYVRDMSSKDTHPKKKTGGYALELIRVFLDLGDTDSAIYVATFISTDEDRVTLKRYLKKPAPKTPSILTLTPPPSPPETKPEKPVLLPAPAPKVPVAQMDPGPLKKSLKTPPIKEEPPSLFGQHRLFLGQKSSRLFVRMREFYASIPKPWIK